MDVRINAQGRFVEVVGINVALELQEALDAVYGLWEATTMDKEPIVATGFVQTERDHRTSGFVDLDVGERPVVQ